MAGHGYCAHCRTGAAVVGDLLAQAAGWSGAPEGSTNFDPFDPESPERTAIEAVLSTLVPAGARP